MKLTHVQQLALLNLSPAARAKALKAIAAKNELNRRRSENDKEQRISDQEPATLQEFRQQCEDGCSREREVLKELLAQRITPTTSSEEKLDIIRTCTVAQVEYYRKDPDYSPDDFVALHKLFQLAWASDSWEVLKQRICLYDDF